MQFTIFGKQKAIACCISCHPIFPMNRANSRTRSLAKVRLAKVRLGANVLQLQSRDYHSSKQMFLRFPYPLHLSKVASPDSLAIDWWPDCPQWRDWPAQNCTSFGLLPTSSPRDGVSGNVQKRFRIRGLDLDLACVCILDSYDNGDNFGSVDISIRMVWSLGVWS